MRAEVAAFLVAAAACLSLYWPGLMAWFAADDFAWLGLRLSIDSAGKFWDALFEPRAQGTIRPLSERIYFLTLERLFGLNATPFRVVAFATQLANLWMAMRLCQRVTGSLAAGLLAVLIWIANSALAQAMSWSSAYNQILWPALVLGGLHCRWTWLTEGPKRARVAEWVLFLLGFGALEMQVVYPLLAGGLTLLHNKDRWREPLPMVAVSAAYTLINRLNAKPQTNPLYVLHFDASVFSTLGKYARMIFGVWRPGQELNPEPWQYQAEAVAAIGMVAALVWALRNRDKWAGFGCAWFLFTLLPVLPLRDKVSDYYLTVPALGFAFAAGRALARHPLVGLVPVAAFAVSSAAMSRQTVTYNHDRAEIGRHLVEGVQQIVAYHPGKTVLLTGVGSEAFWIAVNDNFFRLIPSNGIFLTPGSEDNIQPNPDLGDPARFVAAPAVAMEALRNGSAVVYSAAGDRLVNVTGLWRRISRERWANSLSPVIEMSRPMFAPQLGEGWNNAEDGKFRWSTGRSKLRLGPVAGRAEIFLRAFRPSAGDPRQAVQIRATINGRLAGNWTITSAGEELDVAAAIPPGVDTGGNMDVLLEIDPPIREHGAGGRELGLVFGTIGIRSAIH